MDPSQVLRSIDEVTARPKCSDWGAKVYFICESFWKTLAEESTEVDHTFRTTAVSSFAALLQNSDAFAIAETAIPELRPRAEVPPLSSHQRYIFAQVKVLRERQAEVQAATQGTFDNDEYRREKRVLYEAEMQRLRLITRFSGRFTEEDAEEICAWFDQCPRALLSENAEGGEGV